MNRNSFFRRRSSYDPLTRRRQRKFRQVLPYVILAAVFIVLLGTAGWLFVNRRGGGMQNASAPSSSEGGTSGFLQIDDEQPENPAEESPDSIFMEADRLAAGYDYDGAIALLTENSLSESEEGKAAIARYEETKSTLVRMNPREVTHVFFHTLIMDTSKAFDGDTKEKGYNQVMTTKEEFEKILDSMYKKGYVLVRLHDLAQETENEDGTFTFKEGDIMLPPGKQPFVMSQDDVCYYEYMEGDGFASRIIVGEDGRPTCEMEMDDGTVQTGSFDLVPMLDDFIDEHPDFSYRGAKAVIAFTGYNGILGYRTADSYSTEEYREAHPGFDFEKEREQAAITAECLKADGFELASHSWGHRDMGNISMEHFRTDTDKWEREVETLTGPSDIILFPFGSDIGDWHPYSQDNERFRYLYDSGFRYFCNVDSSRYFVQIGDHFVRQGRRNLDGYRMYYDLPETDPVKDHLSDLFDVTEVFDRRRPTPVPKMTE